jgi:hypothetical protein
MTSNKTKCSTAATIPVMCLGMVASLAFPAASEAQELTIQSVPDTVSNFPTIPAGMTVTCVINAVSGAESTSCPVIKYQGITTWALSFLDNRYSMGIVSYDSAGRIVNTVVKDGARYVYKITSDTAAQTVTIWGQSDRKIVLPWSAFGSPPTVYSWVSASAPLANSVTAPDAPNRAVCRGSGRIGTATPMVAGYWDGAQCVASVSSRVLVAANLQFLTLVSGTAQWISPPGKVLPCEIVSVPANAVSAGTYASLQEIVCSQAGYVGVVWRGSSQCDISAPGALTCKQNAMVLVGSVK